MNISLIFDEDWLKRYADKGEKIPGTIYLQHEGVCYPDDEWIDNPVVLLGWWLLSVDEIYLTVVDRELLLWKGISL